MNRVKSILSLSTRLPKTHLKTQFSPFIKTHNKPLLFFSTQPNPIIQLVIQNKWSNDLEIQLSSHSDQNLTHESIMYVLKKLDRDPIKACNFFNWVSDKNGFTPNSAIFSLALRVFACKATPKQFWGTVKRMKELGFCIDKGTYLSVLKGFKESNMGKDVTSWIELYKGMNKENEMNDVANKVFDVITQSGWGPNVEKMLKEMDFSLSEDFILRVLARLGRNPFEALSFFKWVGEDLGFEHNSVSYNAICRVLCGEDSIMQFWDVLKEMRSLGHEMDIDTYVKISRRLRKNKMLKDVVELYEFMIDGPYKPLPQECSVILRSIALPSDPDMDLVFRVVKKFEESGNVLAKVDYDGIHRSLTSVGRFDEAEKILETMSNAGYEPDNITYSQLVYGLCKARRFEEASKVLDEMKEKGCEPDLKTWTILIQGHVFADEVDKAMLCFAKMLKTDSEPDADLLGVLVNGFINQNKVERAYELLTEMVDIARLRPWQATYKLLIEKLLEKNKFDEAMDALRLMKKHNYPPFPEPFVKYISKFGTVENADEFLKALTVKEYPSVAAYVHVFESFFGEGRHLEAKDLLYKSPFHIRKHETVTKLFGSADNSCVAAA